MINLILKLIAPLAKPSRFSSIARSILKMGGVYLTAMGFSDEAVNSAVESLVPIVAGLASMAIGLVASHVAAPKKAD